MYKVLLVDDEPFVRQGLRKLIDWQAGGFDIAGEACNGAEALAWTVEHRPDLVITDIRMPVLGGLELVDGVREAGLHAIAFILLSGYEDFKYAQQAVRSGVRDYLLKPIDEDELRAALARIASQLTALRRDEHALGAALAEALLAPIEAGDRSSARQAADRFAEALRTDRLTAEAAVRAVDRLIALTVGRLRGGHAVREALGALDKLMRWKEGEPDADRLLEALTTFALRAADLFGDERGKERGTIHSIRSYIEAHYREDITLKEIAARFYMNPVYVGQLFRRTYGILFNDYVLGLRIGEAKRLLLDTDMLVYEIAERVGFNSPNYFVAQFEKLERMTPSRFRSRQRTHAGKGGESALETR